LPRPLLTNRDDPILQDTRLQPLSDQADDAWVADPMLDKADQPTLADFVEKGPDDLPAEPELMITYSRLCIPSHETS
jgi:site-specific DNA recombinase